jgi:hypothetical protein
VIEVAGFIRSIAEDRPFGPDFYDGVTREKHESDTVKPKE